MESASKNAPKPTRSPAKRVRVGKEDGDDGYGALPALTETGEAEWSQLHLTYGDVTVSTGVWRQE